MFQESQSSSGSSLSSAGGQQVVNFLHWVGVLVSAKQLKDMAQDIIYIALEEKLNVLDFVLCLSYYDWVD